ncbi:hypothetical protein WDU94_012575 [Cyamophila willieti]
MMGCPRIILNCFLTLLHCYCALTNLIFFLVAMVIVSTVFGVLYRVKIISLLVWDLFTPVGDWMRRFGHRIAGGRGTGDCGRLMISWHIQEIIVPRMLHDSLVKRPPSSVKKN